MQITELFPTRFDLPGRANPVYIATQQWALVSFPRLSGGVQVIMAGDLAGPGLVGVSRAAMGRSFVKNAGHDDAAGRAGHGA